MRKGTFAKNHYVLRMCLAKQAKLSTSFLGKMNHAILLPGMRQLLEFGTGHFLPRVRECCQGQQQRQAYDQV